MKSTRENSCLSCEASMSEGGFSVIEVVIALVILMVTVMGVFAAFTYATVYNSGNNKRSQALSVMQREVELLRSLKFNPVPAPMDPSLAGGVKATRSVTAADGAAYSVDVTVDDDPFTAGIQTDATKQIKEITLTVTPIRGTDTWVRANPITVVFRRVCSN
jgi:type II secretory pathway pseudopilin PulG